MKQIAGKEGRRGLRKALPKRHLLASRRHGCLCAKQRQIGPGRDRGRVIGRKAEASEHLHPRRQPEGDSRNATRCSSTSESGFSLHKIFKGLQILETGVLVPVLVLEFVKTILSALVINPGVV